MTRSPVAPDEMPVLDVKSLPLSEEEVDYPLVPRMHSASSLETKEEVVNWRGTTSHFEIPKPEGRLFYLKEVAPEEVPHDTVQEVILRRGSTRMFSHSSMTFSQLSTILYRTTRGIPTDFLEHAGMSLNGMYVLVNAVDELPSGSYFLRREEKAVRPSSKK